MPSSDKQLGLYRLLVEHSLGLMCVHDLDGVLLTANSAVARSLGYRLEDSLGRNLRDFLAPSVRFLFDEYLARMRKNPVESGLMRVLAKDGTERIWFYRNVRYEEPGSPVLVLGHALDITDRRKAERELRESHLELARAHEELELRVAERTVELRRINEQLQAEIQERAKLEEELLRARELEAIGRLAGGIAHNFNNLLTIILGYGESLRTTLAGNPAVGEQVDEICRAAEQASSLTRQLLAFGRRQSLQPGLLHLSPVLVDLAKMLRRLVSADIELDIRTDSTLDLILADRGQIEQIIVNLVINANDAMPRGGRLTLAAENVNLEPGSEPAAFAGPPGPFVCLTVSDTGTGMEPEIKERIFDPFFTTKEQGKGTGLGLASVYGIVNQASGYISVESEPGKGSTFCLYFPRAECNSAVTVALQPPVFFSSPPPGSEVVMVVDDVEGLRTLLCDILQKNGYRVLLASNGLEALNLARKHPDPIDLLITDIVMPFMGGVELAEALPAFHPRAKILFMSGYTGKGESTDQKEFSSLAGHPFIGKPFTPGALLRIVRETLEGGGQEPGDSS
jgi:PAS domain S-box-containing protein